MKSPKKVFLIGPMGAGKTTIGRHLATVLSLPFIDTDHEIEERCGADIPWIFDVEGEEGFRLREHKVLHDICESAPAVIATGGGIISDTNTVTDVNGITQSAWILGSTPGIQTATAASDGLITFSSTVR